MKYQNVIDSLECDLSVILNHCNPKRKDVIDRIKEYNDVLEFIYFIHFHGITIQDLKCMKCKNIKVDGC